MKNNTKISYDSLMGKLSPSTHILFEFKGLIMKCKLTLC